MKKARRFNLRRRPWWPWELVLASAGRAAESRLAGDPSPMERLLFGKAPPEMALTATIPKPALRRLPRRLASLALRLFIAIHIFWIGTTSLLIFSYKYIEPSATVLMAWRKWADGWKIQAPRPVPLKAVPFWMRSMLISVEDHKFYSHHGFDFEAIKQAYEIDRRLAQPLYGGSTLTMQVARTLFLVPAKSYARKYFEVIATVELEAILGKDRILTLYFGYAEWGKGLFGVDAASRRWFGKGVRGLDREEGARLVAILSSPIKYRPTWFGRSLILQERYDFLVRKYLPSLEPEPATAPTAAELPVGVVAPTTEEGPAPEASATGSLPAGSSPPPEAQIPEPSPGGTAPAPPSTATP